MSQLSGSIEPDRLLADLCIQRVIYQSLNRAIEHSATDIAAGNFAAVLDRVTELQALRFEADRVATTIDRTAAELDRRRVAGDPTARSLQNVGAALSAERALAEQAWGKLNWSNGLVGYDQVGAQALDRPADTSETS